MDIYAILLIGLMVSLLARFIARRKGLPSGWVADSSGLLGAFFGGWLGQTLGLNEGGGLAGYVMSVAGAILFVAVYRTLVTRRASA